MATIGRLEIGSIHVGGRLGFYRALADGGDATPVGMMDEDSAGSGTVMRPDTLRAYGAEAGFDRVDVLPIEHDFWRFYRSRK